MIRLTPTVQGFRPHLRVSYKGFYLILMTRLKISVWRKFIMLHSQMTISPVGCMFLWTLKVAAEIPLIKVWGRRKCWVELFRDFIIAISVKLMKLILLLKVNFQIKYVEFPKKCLIMRLMIFQKHFSDWWI